MHFVYHMFQVWLFCEAKICVITKTKTQTSKCLQIARFRSDPPQETEGCLHFADSCFANILFLLISARLNAGEKP